MINETVDNIKKYRKLLTEGVSPNEIKNAIEKHKILYIYYEGDDTVLKGYRTIRPFVYGTLKNSGEPAIRAWQDAGNSDGFKGIGRKPRSGHEIQKSPKLKMKSVDPETKEPEYGTQPGWRLFKLRGIKMVYPTGYKFNPEEFFKTPDGVEYKPNDKQLNVEVAIPKETPDKTDFDDKVSRFDNFFNHAERVSRAITKDEIEQLGTLVTKYRKKAKKDYWVVQNDNGDMILRTKKNLEQNNIPNNAIVGNLQDLYNRYVLANQPIPTEFFDNIEKDLNDRLNK